MSYLPQKPLSDIPETISEVQNAVRPISAVAMGYHGYKRTKSIGWALAYSAFGAIAPLVAPAIGLAQGFGKPKSGG